MRMRLLISYAGILKEDEFEFFVNKYSEDRW